MSETWVIASERPAPVRSYPAVFNCPSCTVKRQVSFRHPSGYCYDCMRRGRSYWLRTWTLAEIAEVAALIWPEDFERELAA